MFRFILSLPLVSLRLVSLPLVFLFFISQSAFSQTIGKSLQSIRLEKSDSGFTLNVKPNKDHHFNLDAPTRILKSGHEIKPNSITPTTLTISISIEGTCDYQLQTYVCDDKKTFCAPQKTTIRCEDLKKLSTKPEFNRKNGLDVSLNSDAQAPPPASTTATKAAGNEHAKTESFIVNDPKMALDLAKKSGRPLFIDFFGTWCPPCNILDETVFKSADFLQAGKKFVLLKLDADDKISWDLKSKYTVTGYPTVVLATPDGDEITRFLGAIPKPQILKMMAHAYTNKNMGLGQLRQQFDTNPTPKAALAIIDALVVNEHYTALLKYIPEALKHPQLSLAQKEILIFTPLRVAATEKADTTIKTNLPLLKALFESYPISDIYPQKLELLTTFADSVADAELKKWTHEVNIKNIQAALKKQKLEALTLDKITLLYFQANSYEALSQTENEKNTYTRIVAEYDELIKANRQNPKTNRGYNLERIYALYKSGDVQNAKKDYEHLIEVYPHEFTFHYNYASVLKDLNDLDEALKYANNALKYSYGDNQLRAIYLVSEIEYKKGIKKEALTRLKNTIDTTELPKDKTVRTHRYLKRLADLKKQIEDN